MSEFADLTLSLRRGDVSLTLRAQNRVEMEALIVDVEKSGALSPFLAVAGAPGTGTGAAPAQADAAGSTTSEGGATDTSKGSSAEPTEAEALENLEKHLGAKPADEPAEELASETLLKVVAHKTGKTVDELRGITKTEAKRLEKEAK